MKKIICLIFVMICIIAWSDVSAWMQYPEKPCNIVWIVKNIEYVPKQNWENRTVFALMDNEITKPGGLWLTIDIKELSSGCRIADNGINEFYYGDGLNIKKWNKINWIIYTAAHHDWIDIIWKNNTIDTYSIINTLLIMFWSVVFVLGVYSYIKKYIW